MMMRFFQVQQLYNRIPLQQQQQTMAFNQNGMLSQSRRHSLFMEELAKVAKVALSFENQFKTQESSK